MRAGIVGNNFRFDGVGSFGIVGHMGSFGRWDSVGSYGSVGSVGSYVLEWVVWGFM